MSYDRFVRINNTDSTVVEVFVNTTEESIENLFHPSIKWVLCPDEFVVHGWVYNTNDGTFTEPLPTVDVDPSPEQLLTKLSNSIQTYMDTKAQERRYDGILSLCTYATSTIPKFQAEGQAGVVWRDQCWATAYSIMADVQNGLRTIPTVEELIDEMPEFLWPS